MADRGVLNSRSEAMRSLHSLTDFFYPSSPSSSQHLNRTLLKPTTVTVRSVQALKKQLVAVGLGIKNLYICSKYVFCEALWLFMYELCVFIPVIQWRVSCWRTGGELWPSLFEISGRVGVFCRSLLGPFGLLKLLRSWGLLWMLWRYAWSSCSAGAGLHGVSLTTGGLQFSSQFFSFAALTFQI